MRGGAKSFFSLSIPLSLSHVLHLSLECLEHIPVLVSTLLMEHFYSCYVDMSCIGTSPLGLILGDVSVVIQYYVNSSLS